jgi:hypothetical protein
MFSLLRIEFGHVVMSEMTSMAMNEMGLKSTDPAVVSVAEKV